MSLTNFKPQLVSHRITAVASDGKRKVLSQQVTMSEPVDDGKLITVFDSDKSGELLTVERQNGKYFLNVANASLLKDKNGQELSVEGQLEIVTNEVNQPISIGSGLSEEVIVTVMLGSGRVGKAKITPTSVEIEYEGSTYSSSSIENGTCFDLSMSASVVEGLYSKTGDEGSAFKTPVIFGRGEKCPPYLLGMYASSLNFNEKKVFGDVSIIKVKSPEDGQPMVFFGQKDQLFAYNKGKIERITACHYAVERDGRVYLALERVGDNGYFKVPLDITKESRKSVVSFDNSKQILYLFEGYNLQFVSDDGKTSIFHVTDSCSPVLADQRKWAEYKFQYAPLSQTVTSARKEEPAKEPTNLVVDYEIVTFVGLPNPYYINFQNGRIFHIEGDAVVIDKSKDFEALLTEDKCQRTGSYVSMQFVNNTIFLVDSENNEYFTVSRTNQLRPISKEEYESQASSERVEGDLSTSPTGIIETKHETVARTASADLSRADTRERTSEDSEPAVARETVDPGLTVDASRFVAEHDSTDSVKHGSQKIVNFQGKNYSLDPGSRTVTDLTNPKNTLDFKNFVYDARENTQILQAIADYNNSVNESERINLAEIIDEIATERGDRPDDKIPSAKKPESSGTETTPKAESSSASTSSSSSAPTKVAKDWKKRAETISQMVLILSAFIFGVSAVFLPPLAMVCLGIGATALATNTFSDVFKFNVFENVKKKITKAELVDGKERYSPEHEAQRFVEREQELDRLREPCESAKEKISELCLNDLGHGGCSSAKTFKEFADAYGFAAPTAENPDARMTFDRLTNPDDLAMFPFRTSLVEQLDRISYARSEQERNDMINSFVTQNFSGIPSSEHARLMTIFSNPGSLSTFRNSLEKLNVAQKAQADLVQQDREYYSDPILGRTRIINTIKTLPAEKQLEFLSRHGSTISISASISEKGMASFLHEVIDSVAPENQDRAIQMLETSNQQTQFNLSDSVEKIASQHIQSTAELDLARRYMEILNIAEDLEPTAPTSQVEMLKAYTQGIYHASLTHEESSVIGYVENIDKSMLTVDERLLKSLTENALLSVNLDSLMREFNARCYSLDPIIETYARTGMIESMLPSAEDDTFSPTKSYYSVAIKIAQASLNEKRREHKATDTEEGIISTAKQIDRAVLIEQSEAINSTMLLASKLSAGAGPIDASTLNESVEQVLASPIGSSLTREQAEVIGKARLVAKQKLDVLSTRLEAFPSDEVVNQQVQLYMSITDTIDLAVRGRLSLVRVANTYDRTFDLEHDISTVTPADVCGQTEQERSFNRTFDGFIATLPAETQMAIRENLSAHANSSAADRCKALQDVIGHNVIGLNGQTLSQFVHAYTEGDHINVDQAGEELERLRHIESERVCSQMEIVGANFEGAQGYDETFFRTLVGQKVAVQQNGQPELYGDIIDWIVKTQHISRDKVLVAYQRASQTPGSKTNRTMTKLLFEQLGIGDKRTVSDFNHAQSRIKNLKIKSTLSSLDENRGKDLDRIDTITREIEFNDKLSTLIARLYRDNAQALAVAQAESLETKNPEDESPAEEISEADEIIAVSPSEETSFTQTDSSPTTDGEIRTSEITESKRFILNPNIYNQILNLLSAPENASIIFKLGINMDEVMSAVDNPGNALEVTEYLLGIQSTQTYEGFQREIKRNRAILKSFSSTSIKAALRLKVDRENAELQAFNNKAQSFNDLFTALSHDPTDENKSLIMEFLTNPENAGFVREVFGISAQHDWTGKSFDDDQLKEEIAKLMEKDKEIVYSPEGIPTTSKGAISKRIEGITTDKVSKLAETQVRLESELGKDDEQTRESMEINLAVKKREEYKAKAEIFNKIYADFIKTPSDASKQQAIIEFVDKLENQEFFGNLGITQAALKKLVNDCSENPEIATEIVTRFENTYQYSLNATANGIERFNEKIQYLRQRDMATSQEELDLIETEREKTLMARANANFGKKYQALLNSDIPEERKVKAINGFMTYYCILGELNRLEALREGRLISLGLNGADMNSLIANFNSEDLSERIESLYSEIEEFKADSLELYGIPLDSFDIEDDRIFASQMGYSIENIDELITPEELPVVSTLHGDAKKKALKKRAKKIAKNNARAMKKLNAFARNATHIYSELTSDEEKEKKKVKNIPGEKQTTPEKSKQGTSLMAKLLQSIRAEKQEKQKIKEEKEREARRKMDAAERREASDAHRTRSTEERTVS